MHRNFSIYRKSLLVTLLIVLFTGQLFSQRIFDYGFEFSTVGTSGMNFLKIGAGARSAGLAGTGTSLVGQAENLFHNPAGIAFLSVPDISLTTNNWLSGSSQHSIAVAVPIKQIVVGLTLMNFQINEIEETTVSQPFGTGTMVTAGDLQLGLSLARRFTDKLGIGGQIKFIQETLAEYTANNVLIDLGATYFMGWHDMRVSFVFQHFGPDIQFVDQTLRMPLVFRVGVAVDLLELDHSQLIFASELSHPIDNLEQVSFGLEYSFLNKVYARAGTSMFIGGDDALLDVDHRSTNEESVVFGIGLNIARYIRIDYALNPHRDALGDIHYFSAGFNF